MWRYLKAAFWLSPEVPGLGRFPVNAIAVAGLLILGFGHLGFWMLALGLETAYLALLVTHPRFQRLTEALEKRASVVSDEARRGALVASLPPDSRERLRRLEEQCERLAQLAAGDDDADAVESNRQSQRAFVWLFLKMLVAQQHLGSEDAKGDAARLEAERTQIEIELAQASGVSESLRQSKEATLRILTQRLANIARRQQALEEVASDLRRLEEQVKLALEEARLKGGRSAISFDVAVESQFFEDSFGTAGASVVALDQAYSMPPPTQKSRQDNRQLQ